MPCAECGRTMHHVKTRTRCNACIVRENWRNGAFANIGSRRGDRWTPEEEDLLRAMAGSTTAAQIAEKLGCRTRNAVHMRAHELGVYLQTDDWTLRRVRQLFGTWEPTVTRAWINTGLLKARRLPPGGHCLRGEWRIREADLEAFILDCPWAYDASVMAPQSHRLAQLARRVQRRDPWVTIDQAVEYIGVSRTAIVRWCHLSVIAFRRRAVGQGGRQGHMVIREADLPEARETILRRQVAARQQIRDNIAAFNARRRAARELKGAA